MVRIFKTHDEYRFVHPALALNTKIIISELGSQLVFNTIKNSRQLDFGYEDNVGWSYQNG